MPKLRILAHAAMALGCASTSLEGQSRQAAWGLAGVESIVIAIDTDAEGAQAIGDTAAFRIELELEARRSGIRVLTAPAGLTTDEDSTTTAVVVVRLSVGSERLPIAAQRDIVWRYGYSEAWAGRMAQLKSVPWMRDLAFTWSSAPHGGPIDSRAPSASAEAIAKLGFEEFLNELLAVQARTKTGH